MPEILVIGTKISYSGPALWNGICTGDWGTITDTRGAVGNGAGKIGYRCTFKAGVAHLHAEEFAVLESVA